MKEYEYEWNTIGCASSLAGSTRNKPASLFLLQHGNKANFSCFSTFQALDYKISKTIQAEPCGFIRDEKKGLLNKFAKFH